METGRSAQKFLKEARSLIVIFFYVWREWEIAQYSHNEMYVDLVKEFPAKITRSAFFEATQYSSSDQQWGQYAEQLLRIPWLAV